MKISLQGQLALIVVLSIAATLFVTSVTSYSNLHKATEKAYSDMLSTAEEQLLNGIDGQSYRALILAESVATTTSIAKDFYEKNREALLADTQDIFKTMKEKYGIRQFQFHTAPAFSFLRVHKPEKFGDDLSGFRQTVVKVNETKEPVYGIEVGVAGLGIRGVAPVSYYGRPVGSVEFGLSLDEDFFKDFYQRTGQHVLFVLHRDDKDELYARTFDENVKIDDRLLSRLKKEKNFPAEEKLADSYYAVKKSVVKDFSGNAIGDLFLFTNITAQKDLKQGMLTTIYLTIGGSILFVILVIMFIGKTITKPLTDSVAIMERLKEDDDGVSIPETERHDEIGSIYKALILFKEQITASKKMRKAQRDAEEQAQAQRKKVMFDLAQEFEARVGAVVHAVNEAASEMQKMASILAQAVERTREQSSSVAAGAQEASTNVQTVASAAEEMSASIREISGNISDTARTAKACAQSARVSQDKLHHLQRAVDEIDSVIQSINEVAEQTNLLALNATIEAARAGEAGKGFAVVASEVKALANETHKMTEEISRKVEDIKGSSEQTIASVQDIIGQITSVDDKTTNVASAIEEQTSATAEISRNVQEAARGTDEVSQNIEAVQSATSDSAASTEQLKKAAEGLAHQAVSLDKAVNAFLQEIRSS